MLVPQEHGAYGQLAFPLLTALAVGAPSLSTSLLAAAAVAAFLSHESLLVLLGQRGGRAARDQRPQAIRSLATWGLAAVMCGGAALFGLPQNAILALLVPLACVIAMSTAVAFGRERTTGGELLAAATLSSVSLPVALGGGASWTAAVTVFLAFVLTFTIATLSVRSVIVKATRMKGPTSLGAALVAGSGLVAFALASRAGFVRSVGMLAVVPVLTVCAGLLVKPPAPRQLRMVGWTLVGATAVTTLILIAALR